MTADRGQAWTKLLPSVVNTASDMPQLNLKPMEKKTFDVLPGVKD